MSVIRSKLKTAGSEFKSASEAMRAKVAELESRLAVAREGGDTADVVAVFMGDEDGADILRGLAETRETAFRFSDGETAVDHHAGVRQRRRTAQVLGM